MGLSILDVQRDFILDAVRRATRGEWKILVVDEGSRKLIDNVIKEDDILKENVTHIEQVESRRPFSPDTDAIYLLSVQPYVVDCLLADLQRRRYRRSHLIWTAYLDPPLRRRIDQEPKARECIASYDTIPVEFYPRESHLITFRDPWSFPVLFHPGCNSLVGAHLQDLAQKVVSLCVCLGENPIIRYYRPRNASHEASVLCSHLARFIQEELDSYSQHNADFPPPANRPRGAMYITDRSMDLFTPLIHEFTYQAMAHDLLPIKDGEKVYFKATMNVGEHDEEEKDMEIGENDKIWVENRHRHMKDTIEKLMSDFKKFIEDNPRFTNSDSEQATSLNAIKDMLAGLPQFQELKAAYSLHLSMAQECMNIFQQRKLADLASIEQSLATDLDEDHRKPKNIADQIVRLLDDESIIPSDRLRLILIYLLYRDGLLPADTEKLMFHAQLPPHNAEIIQNLGLLGARIQKPLKDKAVHTSIFKQKPPSRDAEGEYALSRFNPALKLMLEHHVGGTLDQAIFPFTKPQMDALDNSLQGTNLTSQASLRSAKPTWAKMRQTSVEPRQRIIVLMAGGATYAESRACYEISNSNCREVFLATSHMLTPNLFLKQLGDLSVDRRRLDIPMERAPTKAPSHLFEPEPQSHPQLQAQPNMLHAPPAPPTKDQPSKPLAAALGAVRISSSSGAQANGNPAFNSLPTTPAPSSSSSTGKSEKKDKDKGEKKKKHHFFSSKK